MNRGLGFQDGVGRVWRSSNAHLNIFLLLRCVGKRNLPHEMELPRWQVAGTQEGSKWSMGRGLGSQELGIGLGWFRKGQNKAWKGVWVFQGSQECGRTGFQAVQRAPQQLLVAEVCWEEEFSTWDGTSKVATGRYPGRLKMKHGEGLGLRITF